jgi:hypothetical protein
MPLFGISLRLMAYLVALLKEEEPTEKQRSSKLFVSSFSFFLRSASSHIFIDFLA